MLHIPCVLLYTNLVWCRVLKKEEETPAFVIETHKIGF